MRQNVTPRQCWGQLPGGLHWWNRKNSSHQILYIGDAAQEIPLKSQNICNLDTPWIYQTSESCQLSLLDTKEACRRQFLSERTTPLSTRTGAVTYCRTSMTLLLQLTTQMCLSLEVCNRVFTLTKAAVLSSWKLRYAFYFYCVCNLKVKYSQRTLIYVL